MSAQPVRRSWWLTVKAFLARALQRSMESAVWLDDDGMLGADPQMLALATLRDHEPCEWQR